MRKSAKLLKRIDRIFPKPVHPFNLRDEQDKSYAEWQFEKGINTVQFFLPVNTMEEMFLGKTVLDIGCGAAGKTLFYASHGVEHIYGLETLSHYQTEAEALAEKLGFFDRFTFLTGDAAALPFNDDSIDTIIMNDVFEHFDHPEAALLEAYRVLKPGGRIYMNFPPYHHPFGAHLSDAISMPWVHLFFSDETLIEVYKDAVSTLKDADERIAFRIATDDNGRAYFSYINKMTVRRAKQILRDVSLTPIYYHEAPLRNIFAPFAKLPLLRELMVKMVVCVFEKKA